MPRNPRGCTTANVASTFAGDDGDDDSDTSTLIGHAIVDEAGDGDGNTDDDEDDEYDQTAMLGGYQKENDFDEDGDGDGNTDDDEDDEYDPAAMLGGYQKENDFAEGEDTDGPEDFTDGDGDQAMVPSAEPTSAEPSKGKRGWQWGSGGGRGKKGKCTASSTPNEIFLKAFKGTEKLTLQDIEAIVRSWNLFPSQLSKLVKHFSATLYIRSFLGHCTNWSVSCAAAFMCEYFGLNVAQWLKTMHSWIMWCIQNDPCSHKTITDTSGVPTAKHTSYNELFRFVNATFRAKYAIRLNLETKATPTRADFAAWIRQDRTRAQEGRFMLVCEAMHWLTLLRPRPAECYQGAWLVLDKNDDRAVAGFHFLIQTWGVETVIKEAGRHSYGNNYKSLTEDIETYAAKHMLD